MAEPQFAFTGSVRPVCEIGLSSSRQAEPSSWLDVSCYVHEAEVFRGRERFNERFDPGTASVTFSNDNGWADLGGTYAEIAAAQLRPGRQIRIGVIGPWAGGPMSTRWLYRGFIDQATPTYDPVGHDFVVANCIDALGESGSSTAPSGPLQGVNEAASLRINRILDSLGWWPAKRKIDITTTKVQGTQLGSAGIDLMGQAADSAGGVVFGDLDGDVVFRDLDWMLYDPNVPPDGVIGPGVPGPPPVDHPPYLDPSQGVVYDPDDPPVEHPPKVCVCADGSAGTIVEKGDSYKLYVKDGHLYYQSGGQTWDMGPYTGGCTCVSPPSGGNPPVRTDPNDPTIPPIDGILLPPSFAVELLDWNDGGLADPPAASVSVSVSPGHDCLLVVLINAIGTATNAGDLTPTIGGGGLDWSHRRDADQDHEGASGFLAVAAVGRDDPGTFPVTVTWATGMTTRSHIVTVWKVTGAAADYLARFDAGLVLYAVTESNPPDEIQAGNGPWSVDLHTVEQPPGVTQNTRLSDITIAQSLAEEGTPPFGAILNDSNGPWNYPGNEPPVPVPALRAGTETWADDFERANGPLGADWVLGPGSGFSDEVYPFAISGGAAVATVVDSSPGSFPSITNMMHYAVAQGPDAQSIEVEADNCWPSGYVQLFTNIGTGKQSQFADFQFSNEGAPTIVVSVFHYDTDGNSSDETAHVIVSHSGATPVRLRLESDADGTQRAYVDDVLAATGVDPAPVSGSYVGMGLQPTTGFVDNTRFLRASGGSLGRARKTSWVAGWRQGVEYDTVELADVNTGPTNIQSAQACLVLESGETDGGWRLLGANIEARPSGPPPAGTFNFPNAPRPGALLVVMVGMTASSDLSDSIIVGAGGSGTAFSRNVNQHKSGASWGQGAVFTAVAPLDLNPATWNLTVTYPACDTVSAVVYEVTQQDDDTPIGGHASGVLGTNAPGSVNGPSSITLSQPADAAAVVFAYIHVAAPPAAGSGVNGGSEGSWSTEYHSTVPDRAYFQTMSRAPGGAESTSTTVEWHDTQTGTALATSGVELAIEIHPFDGLPSTPAGFGVALGGITDAWNGTINRAWAEDPDSGATIWEFP